MKKSTKLKIRQTLSPKEVKEIMQNEVFNDNDFQRQLLEVSIKLKIPIDVVESVVKHYLLTCTLLLIKLKRKYARIKIYGFFYIDILKKKKRKIND